MRLRARLSVRPWLPVLGAALAALAAGCGSADGDVASPPLEGTTWVLEAGPTALDVPQNLRPTATFTDGTISGFGGCNSYGGSYELDGDAITLGPLGSTLMACAEPQMGIETAYLRALESVATWSIEGPALVLRDPDAAELLRYGVGGSPES